jgi:hypothetical protein
MITGMSPQGPTAIFLKVWHKKNSGLQEIGYSLKSATNILVRS